MASPVTGPGATRSVVAGPLVRTLARLPRRLRILLRTRPLAHWSLTALVAAALAYAVHGVVAAADAERARFGSTTPALVATGPIAPGEVLDAGNTALVDLPVALVAAGSLTARPEGAAARTAIAAGEVVNGVRVGRGGDGPVAAALPDGTRGVSVPLGDAALPLRVGDRVDVVAAITAGVGGAARVVAPGATVAYVGDGAAVVAVTTVELAPVAQALADGGVVLALSAPR
jgi:Flp pilus assembly protein CpaB